jgi:predicted ester cyclase
MTIEENKALVHRFVEEFWNRGNTSAADDLMAPDAEIHMPTGKTVEIDGLKDFAGAFRASFPDRHSTFEELVAEGDGVAERWTGRGTHRGDLMGVPPTGERVEVPGRRGLGVEIVIEVDDVERCQERVAASGHPILEPLQDRPWGLRDFRISDPDGYYLRITSRPASG